MLVKERKEKGEGILTIIKDNNKADVRYYSPDKLPYKDIITEYNEKKFIYTSPYLFNTTCLFAPVHLQYEGYRWNPTRSMSEVNVVKNLPLVINIANIMQ